MRSRALAAHLVVYGVYLAVAIVITWPLAAELSTRLVGHPFGDSYEYARHIWWFRHALQTGQPLFDQPLLAYPDGLSGAWLWGAPLQSFPAWLLAIVLPLPLAFNLPVLFGLALNGWAMYWLAWTLLGKRRGPALLAGLVFMTAPVFQGQLGAGHTGLLVLWPLPLYLYGLIRLHESRSLRWMVFSAVFFVIGSWGNVLLLVYLTLPLTALFLLIRLAARDWRGLGRILGAAALGMLLALPFLLPVAQETLSAAPRLREGNEVRYSADLLSAVTPSFYHPLFGSFEFTRRVLGIEPFERVGYLGVAASALMLIAAWKQRAARWWLLLALVSWVLSLGPLLKIFDTVVSVRLDNYETYITLPWLTLQNLPPFSLTRTPARFNMTVAFAAAVMVGYGAALVGSWLSRAAARWPGLRRAGWGGFALVAVIVIYEYQFFWPLPTIPGVVPQPIQALRERDDVRAVFDIPWDHLLVDKDGLYLQTGHQRPMIGGHVARRTPADPARMNVLQATLDYALLDQAGADVVILHKTWDESQGTLPAFVRSRFGAPFYEDERIAAYEVPAPLDEPDFVAVVNSAPAVSEQIDSYFHAPEPGWLRLQAFFAADAVGRSLILALDGVNVRRWQVSGETRIDLSIPVIEAGYHTITLSLDPPCPLHFGLTLRCRTVEIERFTLDDFSPASFAEPVIFDRGLQLLAAQALPERQKASVSLWWRFDQPRNVNEVRFVHVLDTAGEKVGQFDLTLGDQSGGSTWLELVEIALPADLPPGEYRVYTGWYTLPDVARFTVLSGAPGVRDNLVEVGTFTVED